MRRPAGPDQNCAIDRYEILLFFHVFGAIIWIGFGLAGHALTLWAFRNREWVFAAKLGPAFAWIEPPLIVLGPVVLLGTGIGMVIDGPWGFADTWILVGLGGYSSALALGAMFQGPGIRRMNALVRERGVDHPEALALGHRLNGFMWFELAILMVVLLAMTTKPAGAGSVGFWTSVAVLLAGSGVLAARDFGAARALRLESASGPLPAE